MMMPPLITKEDLIERLRSATGPSLALDIDIAKVFVPEIIVMRQRDDDTGADPFTYRKFTANIEDALWLASFVLPNWQINLSVFSYNLAEASIGSRSAPKVKIMAPTAARALCLAVIKASAEISP